MVCNALVADGRRSGAGQQAMRPGSCRVICGNNTSIVSSSWWWAYNCPKHVEQITSAIKHSVASSWFSSLHLYYDARTNIHQNILSSKGKLRHNITASVWSIEKAFWVYTDYCSIWLYYLRAGASLLYWETESKVAGSGVSVSIATSYELSLRGIILLPEGLRGFFFFSRTSRLTLGTFQPPWTMGNNDPSREAKRPERQATNTHLNLVPRLRVHGTVLQASYFFCRESQIDDQINIS